MNGFAYKNSYNNRKYDRINIMLPKGERDRLKLIADAKGESLNEFIKNAIYSKIDEACFKGDFRRTK